MKIRMLNAEMVEKRKQMVVKAAALETTKQIISDLLARIEGIENRTMTIEERVKEMERSIDLETAQQRRLQGLVDRLLERKHLCEKQLEQGRNSAKNLETENARTCLQIKHVENYQKELAREGFVIEKVMYNQHMEMNRLRRRINRMKGLNTAPDRLHLVEQKKTLSSQLDETQQRRKSLAKQTLKVQEDVNKLMYVVHQDNLRKESIMTKMDDLNLHNEQAERQFHKDRHRKQEVMVEYNVVKLEVEYVRDYIFGTEAHLVSLEEQRLDLEATIKHRLELIAADRHKLVCRRRNLESERMRIGMEFKDRMKQVDRLRSRYEMLLTSAGVCTENTAESAVRMVVDAALAKEELRRKGDTLDAKVRKAAIEVHALNNTLNVVKDSSHAQRLSRDAKPTKTPSHLQRMFGEYWQNINGLRTSD